VTIWAMKKPPCIPDYDAPRRTISDREARVSGFPSGTEVTASITTEQLLESGPIMLFRPKP